jgi:hypothetical protein
VAGVAAGRQSVLGVAMSKFYNDNPAGSLLFLKQGTPKQKQKQKPLGAARSEPPLKRAVLFFLLTRSAYLGGGGSAGAVQRDSSG